MTDKLIRLDAALATIMEYFPGNTINEPKYAAGKSLIEALSALPAVDGWLPIATFAEPTSLSSGNGVLVACHDGDIGEAYYRNFDDESDGWWWSNTSWGDYPEPHRPTPIAWQPLPAPPEI